jgi:hypothetical protein
LRSFIHYPYSRLIVLCLAIGAGDCGNGTKGPPAGAGKDLGTGVGGVGALEITPGSVTLDLVAGGAAPTQAFTVTLHGGGGDRDVTAGAQLVLVDTTLGTVSGGVFTSAGDHGGSTQLVASYTPPGAMPLSASATLHVRVKGTVAASDCGASGCAPFPADGASACPAATAPPQIV